MKRFFNLHFSLLSFLVILLVLILFPPIFLNAGKEQNDVSPSRGISFSIVLPNDLKMEMVLMPKGTFMMGSPENESGRFPWEVYHKVVISEDFWIGKYEVTQAQYQAVMGKNPSLIKNLQAPVDGVTWYQAMDFCEKLNEITKGKRPEGYIYSLPTEAQWEYACRAGTTTSLNHGENMILKGQNNSPNLDSLGWYGGNCGRNFTKKHSDTITFVDRLSDISKWPEKQYPDDECGGSHPVGQKIPNSWGLYDMHGNVSEWCLDHTDYKDGKYSREAYQNGIVDPCGKSGTDRIVRGGSWLDFARDCRSAAKMMLYPGNRDIHVGFRVALIPNMRIAQRDGL